jgi:hypothetical protein
MFTYHISVLSSANGDVIFTEEVESDSIGAAVAACMGGNPKFNPETKTFSGEHIIVTSNDTMCDYTTNISEVDICLEGDLLILVTEVVRNTIIAGFDAASRSVYDTSKITSVAELEVIIGKAVINSVIVDAVSSFVRMEENTTPQ